MYDIIGDIHGYHKELEALLIKMGYSRTNGYFSHPGRKVIFLGDFIDRGPEVRATLRTVRAMTTQGAACAVMGNHEFNALAYATPNGNGGYLRPHTVDNQRTHQATLEAFAPYKEEWQAYLDWFRTLPLFWEKEKIRIVHAGWIPGYIDFVRQRLTDNKIDSAFLKEASVEGSYAYQVIAGLLKGIEIPYIKGFRDKDGKYRRQIRIRWWMPDGQHSYRGLSIHRQQGISEEKVPDDWVLPLVGYPKEAKPVFVGHYWMNGKPRRLEPNIACLDYSVAKQGALTAYRWDGEQELNNAHFVQQEVLPR